MHPHPLVRMNWNIIKLKFEVTISYTYGLLYTRNVEALPYMYVYVPTVITAIHCTIYALGQLTVLRF